MFELMATHKVAYEHYLFSAFNSYTYFGEYAVGFAAILGQEECVRLLIAKGADPNKQDTNGCTVLHLLVIHDKKVGCVLKQQTAISFVIYM